MGQRKSFEDFKTLPIMWNNESFESYDKLIEKYPAAVEAYG
jgi:hypothetical protein